VVFTMHASGLLHACSSVSESTEARKRTTSTVRVVTLVPSANAASTWLAFSILPVGPYV
jgi:hypothetical protein